MLKFKNKKLHNNKETKACISNYKSGNYIPSESYFGDLQKMSNEFMRRRAVDQKNIEMGLLVKFQR